MGFFSKIKNNVFKTTNKEKASKRLFLYLALLEDRCVPAVYYWHTAGNNNNWTTVDNWKLNSYNGSAASLSPGINDDVYFTDNNSCWLNTSGNPIIKSLILDGYTGTFYLNGQWLAVCDPSGNSTFSMNSGTISISGSSTLSLGTYTTNGITTGVWSGGDFVRSGNSNGKILLDKAILDVIDGNINNRKIEADVSVGTLSTFSSAINFPSGDYGTCILDGDVTVTANSSMNFYSTGDPFELVGNGKTIYNNGTMLFSGTSTVTLSHLISQSSSSSLFELRSGEVDFAANDVAQINQSNGMVKLWGTTYLGRSGVSEVKLTGGYLNLLHAYGNPTTSVNIYSGSYFNLGSGNCSITFGNDEETTFNRLDFVTEGDITLSSGVVTYIRYKDGNADRLMGNHVQLGGTLWLNNRGADPDINDHLVVGASMNDNVWTGSFNSIYYDETHKWALTHRVNGTNNEFYLTFTQVLDT